MKLREVPWLPEIVGGLRDFLMPPMEAALKGEQFDLGWVGHPRKWRGVEHLEDSAR
jgi:hypothetical protein